MKKFHLQKTKFKPFHLFYIGFFVLYFLALYYLLYHVNGLQPFQVNIHFFSNVTGSLSKRFLSEAAPYAFIFFLLFYTKAVWKRIVLISLFLILLTVNLLAIGFHFITRSNFQFYVLEGFNWNIFLSFFTPGLTLLFVFALALMGFMAVALFKIKNSDKKIWIFKKMLFIVLLILLAFVSPFIPVKYSAHVSVMAGDSMQKNFYRTIALEDSGLTLLFKEIEYKCSPPKKEYQELTESENALIQAKNFETQSSQTLPNPPKKIVLVAVESFNQNFLSRYNSDIPDATPNLDRLFEEYPHIDDFYPSGPYTLQGLSAMLCGHTNSGHVRQNHDYVCAPRQLADEGFKNEFIRGASKYYVGENIHFKKFGFDTIFAKEEFEEKFPEFKESHTGLYKTWGYTDNYVFNEAIERLKQSGPDEKLFLTLLTVDTHISGGRCFYEKTGQDPKNPLLFSIECFDRVFGEFIENLKKENLFDEDLVVILTSDQLYPGYNSVPGDQFQTSFLLKPAHIPFLMITEADIELKAAHGSQIDIAGTLLDMVNLEIPSYYMGKSLISSSDTIPMGQDRRDGYMVVGNQFYPLTLNPNLQQYTKKQEPKGFTIQISSPEEIQALAQQKVDEREQDKNQESGFFKWYYNKYFNLAE